MIVPRIGQLRERIDIEAPTRNGDGAGGATVTWPALISSLPARVEPLRGREEIMAERLGGVQPYRVIIRYRTDITTEHRIAWGDKILNIRTVANTDERKRFLELICEEGVAT